MRTLVKICGITSPGDARMAAAAGADAIGLVFWPRSPRAVSLELAREIAAALPPFVLRVGVFVDAARDVLTRTADAVGLDILQLHGDETPEDMEGLPRRALKGVRVGPGFMADSALRFEGRAAGILLDTRAETPGGTGAIFPWALARGVRERASFLMLAGGLTPHNVRAALDALQPDAVDVSSGVESALGRKDESKVRAFIEAVRTHAPR
jgi:phosphoribosylanthranilate isomerase